MSCPPTPTPSLVSLRNGSRPESPMLNNIKQTVNTPKSVSSPPPLPPRTRPKALTPLPFQSIKIPNNIFRRRMSSASDNNENNQDFLNHNGKHTTSTPEKDDNNGNGDFRYKKEEIEPVNRNGGVRHNKEMNMTNGTASCECESGAHPKVSSTTQINGNYKAGTLIGNSQIDIKISSLFSYFGKFCINSHNRTIAVATKGKGS